MEPVVLDNTFIQDPHTLYERVRRESPTTQAISPRGLKFWLVTRHQDARAVLSDPSLIKSPEAFAKLYPNAGAQRVQTQTIFDHMLNADPPDHTRLRKLVGKAFTAGTVDRLRPAIARITDDLLDAMAGQDEVDLMKAYASPVPMTVICELLGVPEPDRENFMDRSHTVQSSAAWQNIVDAAQWITTYLTGMIATKRAQPGDDLLTALIEATEDDERLTEHELVAMAYLLMAAGFDTTANLIGNGTYALLRHPEQLARLRADPSLWPDAIEEILRYESPVDLTTVRITTAPVRVGEVVIPADEVVMVSLVAANRDLDRYAHPTEFDITRRPAGHLAFGHGIHFCIGAPLAKEEGRYAISQLFERFPDLALAADPADIRWTYGGLAHGLAGLPVRLGRPGGPRLVHGAKTVDGDVCITDKTTVPATDRSG